MTWVHVGESAGTLEGINAHTCVTAGKEGTLESLTCIKS